VEPEPLTPFLVHYLTKSKLKTTLVGCSIHMCVIFALYSLYHRPMAFVTLPVMTAASLSQLPVVLVLPWPNELAGSCEPLSTHSLIASLTRSRFVLNVLEDTPPSRMIFWTRPDS
jgi:hypothetical protein